MRIFKPEIQTGNRDGCDSCEIRVDPALKVEFLDSSGEFGKITGVVRRKVCILNGVLILWDNRVGVPKQKVSFSGDIG